MEQKKRYIIPEVSVNYFGTEKLMTVSSLSDIPVVPGAPPRKMEAF